MLEELPEGWRILEGTQTEPPGWRWADNGGSRFKPGYEHALVRWDGPAKEPPPRPPFPAPAAAKGKPKPKPGWTYGQGEASAVQTLARHQAIERLLSDIRFDMQVCAIEGWDPREYPRMVAGALEGLA